MNKIIILFIGISLFGDNAYTMEKKEFHPNLSIVSDHLTTLPIELIFQIIYFTLANIKNCPNYKALSLQLKKLALTNKRMLNIITCIEKGKLLQQFIVNQTLDLLVKEFKDVTIIKNPYYRLTGNRPNRTTEEKFPLPEISQDQIATASNENLFKCITNCTTLFFNSKKPYSPTPLMFLIEAKELSKIKTALLLPEIDVNIKNENKDTLLHQAIKCNNEEIITLLLNHPKINPNLKNALGDTPLVFAVRNNYFAGVRLLVSNTNVDIDPTTESGRNALLTARLKIDILGNFDDKILNALEKPWWFRKTT